MFCSGITGLVALAFSEPATVTACFALSTMLLGLTEGVFWTAATGGRGAQSRPGGGFDEYRGQCRRRISPQISPRIALDLGWNGAFAVACGICALGSLAWFWIRPHVTEEVAGPPESPVNIAGDAALP